MTDMKPMPAANAARAASFARGRSRAPTACPTRTAAAAATPNGTMNVSAASVIAI